MPSNTTPNFTLNGNVTNSGPILNANVKSDGSGVITGGTQTLYIVLTPGANGSFVEYVRFLPTATTAGTTTTATVGRVFLSTVSTGSPTSANTFLVGEIALPAISADSATAAVSWYDLPINLRLPAGTFLLVSNHAAPAANTAWIAFAVGGDY